MSHELRTPLNAVLGFAQLLALRRARRRSRPRASTRSSRRGQHLLALINEVLDIARIEAGHAAALARAGGARRRGQRGARARAPAAPHERDDRRCSVDRRDGDELRRSPTASGSSRCCSTCSSNAIKYNRAAAARVRVARRARRPTDATRIEVIDTGRGIPAERSTGSSRRSSGWAPSDRQIEGTGLGLALSQRPGRGDGRRHRRRERAAARGSTFWVELADDRRARSQRSTDDPAARSPARRAAARARDACSTSRTTSRTCKLVERDPRRPARDRR